MFILNFHLLYSLIFSMLQSQLKTLIKSYWTSFQYHYSIITQFRYQRLLIFQFSSFSSAQSPVPYLINSNQCWNCNTCNTIYLLYILIYCNFFSSLKSFEICLFLFSSWCVFRIISIHVRHSHYNLKNFYVSSITRRMTCPAWEILFTLL